MPREQSIMHASESEKNKNREENNIHASDAHQSRLQYRLPIIARPVCLGPNNNRLYLPAPNASD